MKIVSRGGRETKQVAAELATQILNVGRSIPHATVIALSGELGAGKTTFIQGFAKALGIRNRVASPTFLIFRNYKVKLRAGRPPFGDGSSFLYHFDLYRVRKPKDVLDLGFKQIIAGPQNIVLIEWAEKIRKYLPKDTIWIYFKHGRKENERLIDF